MTGDPLPNSDHIARICERKYVESEGVASGAFMLRKDEGYLSVQWLEHLGKANRQEEIGEAREIFSRNLKLRPSAKIAVLNVEKTCDHVVRESGFAIWVLHQPAPNDCAHSGIFGTDQDHELIAELIRETIQEIHPAL